MTALDDLRMRADAAEARFSAACAAVSGHWDDLRFHEDPGARLPGQRSAWSPRDVVEHTLSAERINLGVAARVVREHADIDITEHMRGLPDFDWGNRSYTWIEVPSANHAADALRELREERESFFGALTDADLDLPAGMGPFALQYMEGRNVPVTATIGGLVVFNAEHMLDHAEQIGGP